MDELVFCSCHHARYRFAWKLSADFQTRSPESFQYFGPTDRSAELFNQAPGSRPNFHSVGTTFVLFAILSFIERVFGSRKTLEQAFQTLDFLEHFPALLIELLDISVDGVDV
jgi:hypothetical protein